MSAQTANGKRHACRLLNVAQCLGQSCDLWWKCVSPSESSNVTEGARFNRPWPHSHSHVSFCIAGQHQHQAWPAVQLQIVSNAFKWGHTAPPAMTRVVASAAFKCFYNYVFKWHLRVMLHRLEESRWSATSGRNEKWFVAVVSSRQQ